MPEQTPEIVAAADVSPVSPKPIHTSAASPALVPSLQDHAAALDVAYLDSLTTAPFPFVAMPATPSADPATNTAEEPQTSLGSDSIVVQGDEHSDGSRNDDEAVDNGSVDAYGEDDDGQPGDENSPQPSHVHQVTIESGTGNENDAPAAQPDVAEASSESMINTPATTTSSPESSDLVKSESPAAVPPHSAEPDVAGASGAGLANAPDTNEHPEAEAASQAATDNSASGRDAALAAVPTHVQHQEESAGIDIKKLVDSISATADPSPSSATTAPQAPPDAAVSPVKPAGPFISLPQSSSLPPKPVLPQRMGQPGSRPEDFHPFPSRGGGSSQGTPLMSMQGVVPSQAAPNGSISHLAGATSEGVSSLPPIPQTSFNGGSDHYASLPNAMPASAAVAPQRDGLHGAQIQQAWETFQDDEKRYMTEAKWERFPDNSRIFIGNLSSERVSKREVFDLFHRFGRLAQISLKSAYGFVQYHTAEDAEAAMQAAQGSELGGRKIHLEFSRTQKKKDPQDRDQRERSPNRRGPRGAGASGRGGLDRYDGRERDHGRRRDDYRPGRSPSPRRDEAYGRGGRDRRHSGPYDRNPRSRSRSPRYGRYGLDSYRRQSPSPRRRDPPEPHLDIPQRYGDQVPDVQLLLLKEVQRDFVSWVQRPFYERGLKADVMFINPRFSRDSVLQKLVVEGVQAVAELDSRAQAAGKIPLRVFDRSAGTNVRFDEYQDLDPTVAAELVLRAKLLHAQPPQTQPAYPGYPPNPYSQYPQAYPPPQFPPAGYPYAHPPPAAPQAPAAITAQDIAGLAGQVDNNTLQALLASLSAGQHAPHAGGVPPAAPGMAPPVDVNALLSSLNGAPSSSSAQHHASAYGMSAGYVPQISGSPMPPTAGHIPQGLPGANGVDTAQQVQNIMNSLAKHR